MDFEQRLAAMRHQARYAAGAGHRVPLVAHPAGIEEERPALLVRHFGRRPERGRYEARPSVLGRKVVPIAKETRALRCGYRLTPQRPLRRRHRVVFRVADLDEGADIEEAP